MKRRFIILMLVVAVAVVIPLGTVQARQGGDLNIAIVSDPESLDPVDASSSPAAMVMLHSMEALFDMTPDGEIVPQLAEDYEVSEDGLEYEIYLREGVEFHDGTYFDAEAAKFNLERFLDEEAPFSFLIDEITDIEVVDDYSLRLYTDEPFAPLMAHLSHEFVAMASPDAVEEYGEDFGVNPVGTGPFEFVEWTRGDEIVMERNDDYWGDNAYLDTVTFSVVPEDSTRVVMTETGEADAMVTVPPRDVERLEGVEGVNVIQHSSLRTIYIGMHTKREPFDDVRVRQALNYAVDNRAIVEQIMDGAGRPSDAPIAPDIFGYAEQEAYEYDPDRARELLAEAGYEDGFEVTFHHPVGRYPMDETVAQAVQSQLADVGVDASLETMEWATYLEFLEQAPEEAEHEMYLLGWGTVTGDADYGLYALFHSTQQAPHGNDYSYLGNERVDELLDQARINPDTDDREEMYAEAIEIIWEEAPWIFLHSLVQINAEREGVEGLIHHPREYISAEEAYIVEDED